MEGGELLFRYSWCKRIACEWIGVYTYVLWITKMCDIWKQIGLVFHEDPVEWHTCASQSVILQASFTDKESRCVSMNSVNWGRLPYLNVRQAASSMWTMSTMAARNPMQHYATLNLGMIAPTVGHKLSLLNEPEIPVKDEVPVSWHTLALAFGTPVTMHTSTLKSSTYA